MKIDEVRGKNPELLAAELAAMKRELFDVRFKSASQSLPDPSRIRMLRRTIARMGTVVRERELQTKTPVHVGHAGPASSAGETGRAGKTGKAGTKAPKGR
jgi:large subunit ribosomal protein L29